MLVWGWRGTVGFWHIYLSKLVSHIHNWYQTDQHMTEDSTKRLMGYIVHFYSFRQTFMRKCNEFYNTPLAEIFVWGWVISLSNSFTCNMNIHYNISLKRFYRHHWLYWYQIWWKKYVNDAISHVWKYMLNHTSSH